MRVTIVKEAAGHDVTVDGETLHITGLDLDANISAIQWYGTHGEKEFAAEEDGRHASPNEPFTNSYLVDRCVVAWRGERDRLLAEAEAEREAWFNSWERIRLERDAKIAATDWAMLPDAPVTDAQRAEATDYRQALRDVPQSFAEPKLVTWPAPPTFLEA